MRRPNLKRPIGHALRRAACALRHGAYAERAANALHSTGIDPEPLGDNPHARTAWLTQRSPYGVFLRLRDGRTPKPLALTPGTRKPRTDSFLNHAVDPVRYTRVMGAFFPDMVREAIKDERKPSTATRAGVGRAAIQVCLAAGWVPAEDIADFLCRNVDEVRAKTAEIARGPS